MLKAEWGVKRTCLGCGARFYDLKRAPVVCPKCGDELDIAAPQKPKRVRPAAAATPAAKVAVKKTDDLIDDADDPDDNPDDDPDTDDDTDTDDDDGDVIVAKGADDDDDSDVKTIDGDVLLDDADNDDDAELGDVKSVKTGDDDPKDS